MKKMIQCFLVFTIIVYVSNAYAQALHNAELWHELKTDKEKILYLTGMLDGMLEFDYDKAVSEYYLAKDWKYFLGMFDKFYHEHRNAKIYIIDAWRIITMEMNGEPQEKIEEFRKQQLEETLRAEKFILEQGR